LRELHTRRDADVAERELQRNLDVSWALTGLRDFELTTRVFEITEVN
jgi:hypothetical protein